MSWVSHDSLPRKSEPILVMEDDVVVVEVVHYVAYHYVFHYFAGDTGERDGSVVGGRAL